MTWNSYNSIAELYETASVPKIFVQPAKDLVEITDIKSGELILDVGTGTGATASAVRDVIGNDETIYGIDMSEEMLKHARAKGISKLFLGVLPDLPFCNSSFDVVLSSFVLSHLQKPEVMLLEMRRVLKEGGRIGISGWKQEPDQYGLLWREIAGKYIDLEFLDAKSKEAIPHEKTFSSTSIMADLLDSAEFSAVRVEERTFEVETTLANFLMMRESAMGSRVIRNEIPQGEWDSMQAELHQTFSDKFEDPISFPKTANFAVGLK
jgi:ubiquinone/menaquinone biosynthesis C-methylase UbiE